MKTNRYLLVDRVKTFLLDLLYPRRAVCMGCGSMIGCDRDDLCEACREKLAKQWVGVKHPERRLKLDGAAYAYYYHGPAGGMVRNLKYSGVQVLTEGMARDLARAIMGLQIEHAVLLTSVPMHPKRKRRRGLNHAEVLGRAVAERLELEYTEILMRSRNAPQQARLSHEERRKNLEGGFAVRPECLDLVRGAEILLIDDVFTTGATAAACADALKHAGADKVYFAAYAYGERKQHG